jgi:RNA polymerase sigma factor (TIGR02999 family)
LAILHDMSDVARILSQNEPSDPRTAENLLPLVYAELRMLAAAKLAHEKPGQTLQATALVHEAFMRLVDNRDSETGTTRWQSQAHFFAAAAEAMRRILIDLARNKGSHRKGGGQQRCNLSEDDYLSLPIDDTLLDLDSALTRLEKVDAAAAQTVKLRVFAGMTVEQAADVLNVSARTAKRNWAYARAWLSRELASYAPADT